ncbi:MAG: hypothetical protein A3F84_18000 [Candidatus Handelsmanbacteria bacterium RIFCSPLOWO2_12_FULL_64_10]|uniref:PPM-type phosphatase domain-containing protein n=1 Tax=Handelsmanbacteria sp. (strain RIFCSPLOWO2_12_FULL_64_10) TaxID=1817868 RepID=A0A1F6CT23_HANXR|nr:MAG: hypothetical protein A3F84_18000 [Candidatus Handelsmanbacteria bacterium RIFCSPLOWO2_12_FULL_64_10]
MGDSFILGEVHRLIGSADDLAWLKEMIDSRRNVPGANGGIRWVAYKDHATGEPRLIRDRRRLEDRRRRDEAIATLLNVGTLISSSLDLDRVIASAMEALSRVIRAEASSIILIDRDELVITEATGPMAGVVRGLRFERSKGIAGWVIDNAQPLIVHDVRSDARWFPDVDLSSDFSTLSILCAPLRARGRLLGVVELLNKEGDQRFDEWDLSLIQVFANQAGIALDNARLHREALERQRIETELALAARIQRGLLPGTLPQPEGVEVAGMSVACEEVAGDYYDVIPLCEGRFGLAIADVSGKGIPAALLMSSVRTALYAEVRGDLPLPEVMSRMNDLLYREGSGTFATCVYAVLDPRTYGLKVANAGHNFPFLLRTDGTCERLRSTGLPLGLLPTGTIPFTDLEGALHPGDSLILYTDGVPEASRGDQEQFGEARLEELVCDNRELSADALRQRIYDEVLTFIGDARRSDDITVMVLKAF